MSFPRYSKLAVSPADAVRPARTVGPTVPDPKAKVDRRAACWWTQFPRGTCLSLPCCRTGQAASSVISYLDWGSARCWHLGEGSLLRHQLVAVAGRLVHMLCSSVCGAFSPQKKKLNGFHWRPAAAVGAELLPAAGSLTIRPYSGDRMSLSFVHLPDICILVDCVKLLWRPSCVPAAVTAHSASQGTCPAQSECHSFLAAGWGPLSTG